MPRSCMLDLFSFLARKMMRSSGGDHLLHLCLFCMFSVCFQSSPAKYRFLNLLTVAWFIQHSFAIRLCFLQSLNKDSTISFCCFVVVYFQLENGRHFDFLNVVTSTYARHSLNARNELLVGNVFFRKT